MLYDTSGWQCGTHTQWPSAALRRQGRQNCHALHCGRRPLGFCTDHPCGSQWSDPRGPFPSCQAVAAAWKLFSAAHYACCEHRRAGEPPAEGSLHVTDNSIACARPAFRPVSTAESATMSGLGARIRLRLFLRARADSRKAQRSVLTGRKLTSGKP